MSVDFGTYAPDKVSFTFKGNTIGGYAEGTFIEAERSSDGFTKHVGSLGDVARTASLDRTGKVTLTLMAISPSNDVLQAIADQDEKFRTGTGTLQIQDHYGHMEVHCSIGWIMKRPKIDRAEKSGNVIWIFECADLEINAGGNVNLAAINS